jgi:hypothetical protein
MIRGELRERCEEGGLVVGGQWSQREEGGGRCERAQVDPETYLQQGKARSSMTSAKKGESAQVWCVNVR